MKRLALALAVAFTVAAFGQAAEVLFVSYDKDKMELKVKSKKDDPDAKTYKVSDKTTFKNADKDMKTDKGLKKLEGLKSDAKLDLTVEKDDVSEVKFVATKKKTDKSK